MWGVFWTFVLAALYFNWHNDMFSTATPFAGGKFILWLTFLGFTGYSYYCSLRENLFKTMGIMAGLHWGRQIGIDLYIGLGLSVFIICLHQGGWLVASLWLLPILAFGNMATLLYFAIHFDSILTYFGRQN